LCAKVLDKGVFFLSLGIATTSSGGASFLRLWLIPVYYLASAALVLKSL
jgi:hypothetical protein